MYYRYKSIALYIQFGFVIGERDRTSVTCRVGHKRVLKFPTIMFKAAQKSKASIKSELGQVDWYSTKPYPHRLNLCVCERFELRLSSPHGTLTATTDLRSTTLPLKSLKRVPLIVFVF
jgi:hypothetical protein